MKITFLKNHGVPAFLGADFEISYASAYAAVCAAASRIPRDGMHAAIFAENSPEWACALYAVWKRMGVVVPVDANSLVSEAAFILGDSECDFMFTSRANLEKAREAAEKSGREIEICVLEEIEIPLSAEAPGGWSVARSPSDLAFIVYTSGTTSNPKGVMLTFDNLQANIEAVADEGYYSKGMRILAMLPFHHILPLVGTIIGVLYVGGSIIFPKSVAPADIAGALVRHRATSVISVPRFYELLRANIMEKVNRSLPAKAMFLLARFVGSAGFSRFVFSSIHNKFGGCVKTWVSGGAALDREAAADLATLGFCMCEGYGMTEAAPIISFPRMGKAKIGACGQPLPSNEVRIVDGEITVRGRSITSGYYKRPEENASSFNNGWLYTGDLGYQDEDGYIFITGRRKEIIVLPNGKKLNPVELEAQIRERCPDIEEVGVLMCDDIIQAVVRLTDAKRAELAGAGEEDFVRENAILPYNRANASYKRIIRFTVTDKEFPRTRIGKLKRFKLASFIESVNSEPPQEQDFAPEPDSRAYKALKEFAAMQVSVPVSADAHLEMDLGFDSLAKISLHEFIKENYGIDMKESDFEQQSTLRKISEFVDSEQNRPKPAKKSKGAAAWGEILKTCTPPAIPKTYFFHFFTIMLSKLFFKLWYDVRVEGTENIPASGPFIIAPNHQSLCDGFLFAYIFPRRTLYKMYFFAKIRAMMKSRAMQFFVRHSNIIVVDVKNNVRESVQKLAEILRRGDMVVMFPEGTRTRDGEVAEFKPMFSILSKEMNVRVVPMVISGAFEALASRTSIPPRGTKITAAFLPPLSPADGESYQDFASRVRAEVVRGKAAVEGTALPSDSD